MDQAKLERISQEKDKLVKLFAGIDAKTKKAVQSLMDNAVFMAVTLEDVREIINEKGVTETYQNGANQSGVKKSSEVEVYNTMIKNYSSVIKQLTDLLPKKQPEVKDDGFDDFVKSK